MLVVTKAHVVEIQCTLGVGKSNRVFGFCHCGTLFEHARDLLQSRRRILEGVVEHGQLFHGLKEPAGVQNCSQEHTDIHDTVDHTERTQDQHGRESEDTNNFEAWVIGSKQANNFPVCFAVVIDGNGIALFVAFFAAECFDRTNTSHGLHELNNQSGREGACFTELLF